MCGGFNNGINVMPCGWGALPNSHNGQAGMASTIGEHFYIARLTNSDLYAILITYAQKFERGIVS